MKAVFFDLDDTLLWDEKSVKKAFEKTCEHASSVYGLDSKELEEAVRKEARQLYSSYETFEFTKMIGINPFEGLWGTFNDAGEDFQKLKHIASGYQRDTWIGGLKRMGVDDPKLGADLAERFPQERKQSPYLFEDAVPVLEKLHHDYKLLLLTNGSPELQNIKLSITPELKPYFDHIIISGDFGRGKPDTGIFHHALQKVNAQPSDILMVGDNLKTDIKGANQTGITSVWLNRFGKEAEGVTPDYEISELNGLFEILQELPA